MPEAPKAAKAKAEKRKKEPGADEDDADPTAPRSLAHAPVCAHVLRTILCGNT